MLLGDILNGKEQSSCIILQDTLEASARPLLLSFVKLLFKRVDLVCLVCFEFPPKKFVNILDSEVKSKLIIIDGFSNYLKWDSSDSEQSDIPQLYFDSNITDVVWKIISTRCSTMNSAASFKVAIAIDCISKLINRSVSRTCQVLHHLSQDPGKNAGFNVNHVVTIVHCDLHDKHSLETLCSIASSVLHVLPSAVTPEEDLEQEMFSHGTENYCKTLHIRKTGKVLKRKQKFRISPQLELTEFSEQDWVPKPKIQSAAEQDTSKTANSLSDLTFNLKLTKQEEQDRANTHLPYMHHTPSALVKIHQHQTKDSQIFYQPDEADDFDEDDPDDDLDI